MLKIRQMLRPYKIFKKKRIDPFEYKNKNEQENDISPIFSTFMLSIPISSFALGVWQIRRREWKLNLIKSVEDNIKAEPVNLPANLEDVTQMDYRPVKVIGHFVHDDEFTFGPRALLAGGDSASKSSLISNSKTNQGWLIITPFQLHDREERILVNRGWVPKQKKNPSTRQQSLVEGEIELVGVVRNCEKRPQFMPKNNPIKGAWYYRDVDEMARLVNSAPIYLDACGSGPVSEDWPIPNQTRVGSPLGCGSGNAFKGYRSCKISYCL